MSGEGFDGNVDPSLIQDVEFGEIDAAIDEAYKHFLDDIPDAYRRSAESQWRDREKQAESDKQFFRNVYNAAMELAESNEGSIAVLFDIDDTLAKAIYDDETGNERLDVLRPVIPILANALTEKLGDRLHIGLLTTRGQTHLDDELAHPSYTTPLTEQMDPQFVIGTNTRYMTDRSPENLEELDHITNRARSWVADNLIERIAPALNLIRPILDPELEPAIVEDDYATLRDRIGGGVWADVKLAVLAQLAEQHSDTAFVFVDDRESVRAINPNHSRVRGVCAYETMF